VVLWRILPTRFMYGSGSPYCHALGIGGMLAALLAIGLGALVLKQHGQDEEQRFLGWVAVGAGALSVIVNLWLARL
jgi:hypothetical protein